MTTPAVNHVMSEVAPEVVSKGGTLKIISFGLITLSVAALFLQIRASRKAIKAHEREEMDFERRFNELEFNLRQQLGSRYVAIT